MAALEALANGAVSDERVETLRSEMKKAGVDAYIVPSEDAHMVSPCYSDSPVPRADSDPWCSFMESKRVLESPERQRTNAA